MNDVAHLHADELRQHLQQYRHEQELLLEITQRIARGGPLAQLLTDLAPLALRGLQAAGFRVVLSTPSVAFAAGSLAASMGEFDPLIAAQLRQGSPLLCADLREAPPALQPLKGRFGALMALSLESSGAHYGLIWMGYSEPRAFSVPERQFAAILAAQIAVAIANAHAFEAAQRGHDHLSAILTSSVDPILVVDEKGAVVLMNPAAERAFSVSAGEVTGKPIESALQNAEPIIGLVQNGGTEIIEWANAASEFFAPRVSPVRATDGTAVGQVLVLRDITHYKQMRQSQAEFTDLAVHDLKLPITGMLGWIEILLASDEMTAKQRDVVDRISAGMRQLAELTVKILDASKFDPEGNYRLARQQVDVAQLVGDIVHSFRQTAEKKKQTLTVELATNLPILNLDDSVRRAISNLTDNAIKYTPEGGRIHVSATIQENDLVVYVQDNGLGISKADQENLFGLFKRIYRPEFRRISGSGLGLYNVKQIAMRHGGDATVESEPNQGSKFTVRIPLEGPNLIGGA